MRETTTLGDKESEGGQKERKTIEKHREKSPKEGRQKVKLDRIL